MSKQEKRHKFPLLVISFICPAATFPSRLSLFGRGKQTFVIIARNLLAAGWKFDVSNSNSKNNSEQDGKKKRL